MIGEGRVFSSCSSRSPWYEPKKREEIPWRWDRRRFPNDINPGRVLYQITHRCMFTWRDWPTQGGGEGGRRRTRERRCKAKGKRPIGFVDGGHRCFSQSMDRGICRYVYICIATTYHDQWKRYNILGENQQSSTTWLTVTTCLLGIYSSTSNNCHITLCLDWSSICLSVLPLFILLLVLYLASPWDKRLSPPFLFFLLLPSPQRSHHVLAYLLAHLRT